MLFSVEFGSLSARSLTALWVTLSGPAHVVSVREGASASGRYTLRDVCLSVSVVPLRRPPISPPKKRKRERGRARTRTLLPKLEGRVGLPNYLPTLLPTFPCPYCPWRSSNHLCRRSTLGLVSRVPPPLPRSIVLERKVNLVLTDGLKRSELGESRWHCLSA